MLIYLTPASRNKRKDLLIYYKKKKGVSELPGTPYPHSLVVVERSETSTTQIYYFFSLYTSLPKTINKTIIKLVSALTAHTTLPICFGTVVSVFSFTDSAFTLSFACKSLAFSDLVSCFSFCSREVAL